MQARILPGGITRAVSQGAVDRAGREYAAVQPGDRSQVIRPFRTAMSKAMLDEEHIEEEWVEDDAPDDPAADVLVCPLCDAAVHEDTQQCPHCGDWIVPAYPGERSKRWVWGIAVLLVIGGLLVASLV